MVDRARTRLMVAIAAVLLHCLRRGLRQRVRRAADGWDTDESYVVQVPSSVSLNAAAASVHPQPAAPAIIDHFPFGVDKRLVP